MFRRKCSNRSRDMRLNQSEIHRDLTSRSSLDFLRESLFGITADGGQSHLWHVLPTGRDRPLLLPDDAPAPQVASLFFARGRMPRLALGILSRLDTVFPFLQRVALPHHEHLTRAFGFTEKGAYVSEIRCGTKGPLQKASCLINGAGGKKLALAKISLGGYADHAIQHEAECLRMVFEEFPAVAAYAPRIFAAGIAASGRPFLVQEVISPAGVIRTFGDLHREFLASMTLRGTRLKPAQECDAVQEIASFIAGHVQTLPKDLAIRFRGALSACLEILSHPVPFGLVHGDFAYWNTCVREGRLVVFDWEYYQRFGLPLKDLFHFFLIPITVRGGSVASAFEQAVSSATAFAASAFPQLAWGKRSIVALGLIYMLETIGFYSRINKKFDRNDRVTNAYSEFLARYETWLSCEI